MIRQVWCKTALSASRLPGLTYSLNPYKGCSHDCVYCYAPPLLQISPEKWHNVEARVNIPQVLRQEVKLKSPGVVGLSTVTDPYQPAEKDYEITRKCLPLLAKRGFGINIQTKSDLVVRDKDLLSRIENVAVGITITTLDEALSYYLEPKAPLPHHRIDALHSLSDTGIYTYVFFGPIMPSMKIASVPEYVDEIIATGAQEIMVDTLHIKPGVMDRLHAALPQYKLEKIKQCLADPLYYNRIFFALRRACDGRIQVRPAFASRVK